MLQGRENFGLTLMTPSDLMPCTTWHPVDLTDSRAHTPEHPRAPNRTNHSILPKTECPPAGPTPLLAGVYLSVSPVRPHRWT
jgi:hypothetical protein